MKCWINLIDMRTIDNKICPSCKENKYISLFSKNKRAKDLVQDLEEKIKPWFEYGEYLTVEIDIEKGTIEVVKNK